MSLIITGNPGVGKHTIAAEIIKNEDYDMIDINKIAIESNYIEKDEIGVDIHPKFRRKGYARAAYKKYLQDKNFASLWVFEDNFARNLYIDLGFKDTGETQINRGRLEYRME